MLLSLKIENIAIIESAEISFSDGLNVMSGETGSGKSIIIDSLSAVLGERTSKDLIRTGEKQASVTALFDGVSPEVETFMASLGLTVPEDHSILIQRTISIEGRSSRRINGSPATVSMLKELGRELIGIHGQHDSQNLLNPETHYRFLDALGGLDPVYNDYFSKYREYVELYRRFKKLQNNEEENARRIDFLKFEIQEIENADIHVGELRELQDRRDFFRNSEKVTRGLENAIAVLSDIDDEDGAVTRLFNAAQSLRTPAQHLTEAQEIEAKLSESAYAVQDIREQLKDALYNSAYDPSEQTQVDERLNDLFKLRSKYGETEQDILTYLENSRAELELLENSDSSRAELENLLEQKKTGLLEAAEKLSLARHKTAEEFEKKVGEELRFLDMPYAVISTSFTHCRLNPAGSDVIEFLISPNPGEEPKPLAKIASGGELSRIMLAIQNVLAERGNAATLIFDEIDTGVSGSAAEKIAIKLHQVSKKHQVICITHSAQVASYADTHFYISKAVRDGKTYTCVEPLDYEGRVHEVARIFSGVNITELQLQSAREMLETAEKS